MKQFLRTQMLVGEQAIQRFNNARVAVFGLGGVGSYVAEALARSGIGTLYLVDNDVVTESNLNRQLCALHSTVGKYKADVVALRCKDINPDGTFTAIKCFFDETTAEFFDFSNYDYVVDAIDSVKSKLLLAELCTKSNTPLVSSMGTGNKTNATAFKVGDIFETSVCPLARTMRHELKKRGITRLKVVYSTEEPLKTEDHTVGSMPYVPGVAGLILAGEVIKDILAM